MHPTPAYHYHTLSDTSVMTLSLFPPAYPILPLSYPIRHPTTSYTTLACSSLLPHPNASLLSHPTLSYRIVLPSYILLSHTSYPVLPLPTPSYIILPSLTHPTLDFSLNLPTLAVMLRHQLFQTTTLVSVRFELLCLRA